MKRLLLITSAIFIALTASARTDIVSYGDFVFNVINKEYAEVKKFKDKEFTGEVVVPDSVYIEQFDKIMSVKAIGTEAFSDCVNMTTCVIPVGIKSIGQLAFNNCKNLKSVVIPNSVTTIQKGAFMGSGLTDIDLPQSITDIEQQAFEYCPELKHIDLSKCSLNKLNLIFGGTTALESVILPVNLEILKGEVFSNMLLKEVDLPESIKYLEGPVFANNPLERINLKHILWISSAFYNCSKLSEIEWPDNPLWGYDYYAFNGTALSEVIIDKEVRYLINSPFGNIQTLRSVKCFVADPDSIEYGVTDLNEINLKDVNPWEIYSPEVFKGSDLSQCILWVPEGSLELYHNYPMWRDFPDIREMDAAGMPIIKDEQSQAETSCFDLQGRKVTDPQPGNVYIVNGRKLLHQ